MFLPRLIPWIISRFLFYFWLLFSLWLFINPLGNNPRVCGTDLHSQRYVFPFYIAPRYYFHWLWSSPKKRIQFPCFFYDLSFLIQSINLPFFFLLAPGSSAGPNRVDVIRHTHTHAREREKRGASFFVDEIPFLFVKKRKKKMRDSSRAS